jgi:hypothetical protein
VRCWTFNSSRMGSPKDADLAKDGTIGKLRYGFLRGGKPVDKPDCPGRGVVWRANGDWSRLKGSRQT